MSGKMFGNNDDLLALLHELRTPITAIKGALDLLERGTFGELNPTQRELVGISTTGTMKLLEITNQILELSKKEYDSHHLVKLDVDIDKLIAEACQFMKTLFDEKNQRIELSLKVGITIRLDKQLILQVLLNLLSNANKYTQNGGMIIIRSFTRMNRLHVEIEDNGSGVSIDDQKKLFNKYYRANGTVIGTGLGLFICKQTIENHSGRIWVVTKEGEGSTFAFAIPIEHNSDELLKFRKS